MAMEATATQTDATGTTRRRRRSSASRVEDDAAGWLFGSRAWLIRMRRFLPRPLGRGRKRRPPLSFAWGGLRPWQWYQPRAKRHHRAHLTIGWPGGLSQPPVGAVGVQAQPPLLPVAAPNRTEPVAGMPHQRPPLETQRARPPVRLAHAPVVGRHPLQLPSMQPAGNHIPQPGAGWCLGTAPTGGQHPGIHRMTAKRLLVLLMGFREPVLCAQLLGLPALPQLER